MNQNKFNQRNIYNYPYSKNNKTNLYTNQYKNQIKTYNNSNNFYNMNNKKIKTENNNVIRNNTINNYNNINNIYTTNNNSLSLTEEKYNNFNKDDYQNQLKDLIFSPGDKFTQNDYNFLSENYSNNDFSISKNEDNLLKNNHQFFLSNNINFINNNNENNINLKKKKKTLILDLDETLVHSSFEKINNNKGYFYPDMTLKILFDNQYHDVYVYKRPFVDEFIIQMSKLYNLFIFTASISEYANPVINQLDKFNLLSKRLFRENCFYDKENNLYVKDLNILNEDLKDVIIIDNNPVSYSFNIENGLPIKTWHFDKGDFELEKFVPLLNFLSEVDDVRKIIRKIVDNKENIIDFRLVDDFIKEEKIKKINIDNREINRSKSYKNFLNKKNNININNNNNYYNYFRDEMNNDFNSSYKMNNYINNNNIEDFDTEQNEQINKLSNNNNNDKNNILNENYNISNINYINENNNNNMLRMSYSSNNFLLNSNNNNDNINKFKNVLVTNSLTQKPYNYTRNNSYNNININNINNNKNIVNNNENYLKRNNSSTLIFNSNIKEIKPFLNKKENNLINKRILFNYHPLSINKILNYDNNNKKNIFKINTNNYLEESKNYYYNNNENINNINNFNFSTINNNNIIINLIGRNTKKLSKETNYYIKRKILVKKQNKINNKKYNISLSNNSQNISIINNEHFTNNISRIKSNSFNNTPYHINTQKRFFLNNNFMY